MYLESSVCAQRRVQRSLLVCVRLRTKREEREAVARVSGTVSGVSVACPVNALTWGQSALVPSVSAGVSARSRGSPGASDGVPRSAEEFLVASGVGSVGSSAPTGGQSVLVSSVSGGVSAEVVVVALGIRVRQCIRRHLSCREKLAHLVLRFRLCL